MEIPVFNTEIDPELKRQQAEKYPLALPLGTILGARYLVQRVLGQGGFGITYLAWDLVDHQPAAVKEYLPQALAGRVTGQPQMTLYQGDLRDQYDKGMRDFLKEAKVLASFNGHPHIVGARRFFEENRTAYLVMEYVQGQSFKQYIKDRGGRIPWLDALRVMVPVMEALESVHQAGILHRDVAPDNIYITPEGGVKLLDFGAARSAMGNRNQSMTVMLKPGYTPLEQYTRNGKQGPYSDVYSVAATLYGAITGYLPPDAVDRIEEDHLVPISTLGIDIPGQLENAILKGLMVTANKRFQTMGQFRQAVGDLVPTPSYSGAAQAARAEEARKAEELRKAEQARLAEEARKAEEAIKAEEARKAEQAEKARREEETLKAQKAWEAAQQQKAWEANREAEAKRAKKSKSMGKRILSLAICAAVFLAARGVGRTMGNKMVSSDHPSYSQKKEIPAAHVHTWMAADCTHPRTCSVCGETEGQALGHDWLPATHRTPETCSRCGQTRGEPLGYRAYLEGHWSEVTVSVDNTWGNSLILEEQVRNCTQLTWTFQFTEVTAGVPFGERYLYVKDLNGNWRLAATMNVPDMDPVTQTFTFDQPISFTEVFVAGVTGQYQTQYRYSYQLTDVYMD